MQITAHPFAALDAEHLRAWTRIQQSDATFASPFFCLEYASIVASVRDDVWVGVIQDADRIVGLFPFQRSGRGTAQAVGGDVSQFHGVLVEPGVQWNADELLTNCRIESWAFDHLPVTQTPFLQQHHCVGESPLIDLTHGFDAYCAQKRKSGKAIEQGFRKARKLEREVGPLRFELHDASESVFQSLLRWKSQQHQRTKVVDAFEFDWLVRLLDQVRATQTESFAGLMSALYAGEHLVAVHFGMRSGTVAHSWYPAYDIAFAKHSPGITLILKMAEALAREGIQRIDFAARQQIYKTRLMSGAIPVAKGVVDRSRMKACVRRGAVALREGVRVTPFAAPIRAQVRMLRRVGTWWSTREGSS